jgi:hypothetical protein
MNFFRSIYVVLISSCFIILRVSGQDIKVPQNALFTHLLRDTIPVTYITLSDNPIIPVSGLFSNYGQQLVKSSSGLYLFINGTGRIYKVSDWDNHWVTFKRIDSTENYGYNFQAAKLIVRNQIFSFGGYGFFRFNGQLLYFTKQHEWDIHPLNKEIPFANNGKYIFYIKPNDDKFYWYVSEIDNSSTTYKEVLDSFYGLNISEKKVICLGKATTEIEKLLSNSDKNKLPTPYGIFFDSPYGNDVDYLLDIESNTVYESGVQYRIFANLLTSKKTDSGLKLFFYQNGFIYKSVYPFEKIDSVRLDMGLFKKTGKKVYEPISDSLFKKDIFSKAILWQVLFIISLIIILAQLFNKFKNRKRAQRHVQMNQAEAEILNDWEKGLLKEFIDKSKEMGYCSTEQLNSLLGVAQKSIETQKKARTDFITPVNQKLKEAFQTQKDIIIRTRAENDKRSYLYSISKENIHRIKRILE